MIVHTLVAVAAAACTASGTFTTGNASQAWAWNLTDRGGRINGVVAYATRGVQRATVTGTRAGATLSLRIADGSGRVRRAKAGVTCSRPTAQLPIDKILFVRVAGVPVPHLAFPRVRPGSEGALLAAARGANALLPARPNTLGGWLDAMNALR